MCDIYHLFFNPPIDFNSIFPKLSKTFSKTLASDLVSVTPMEAPSGLLFTIDYNDTINRDNIENRTEPETRGDNIIDGNLEVNIQDRDDTYNKVIKKWMKLIGNTNKLPKFPFNV